MPTPTASECRILEELSVPESFKRRILVVDDDRAFLDATTALLSREGYDVTTARDGFEALAVFRGGQPDLLISDLKMPNMSGFELLGVVRRRFPAMAVIARSEEFVPAVQDRVLADAFVGKDVNSGFELLEIVRELLSRSPVRAQPSKPESSPVWVPRSTVPYLVLTCPACLRSFSIPQAEAGFGTICTVSCFHCQEEVSYQLDETVTTFGDVNERVKLRLEATKRAIDGSRKAITHSRKLIDHD